VKYSDITEEVIGRAMRVYAEWDWFLEVHYHRVLEAELKTVKLKVYR